MLKIILMIGHMDGSTRPVEIARMADRAGLYGIAIGEHVALGASLDDYPYAGGLAHADGGRKPYLEPAVLHGAFAVVTSRIRLSHAVMLAPCVLRCCWQSSWRASMFYQAVAASRCSVPDGAVTNMPH